MRRLQLIGSLRGNGVKNPGYFGEPSLATPMTSKRRKIAVVGNKRVRTDGKRACCLNRVREHQLQRGAQACGALCRFRVEVHNLKTHLAERAVFILSSR